MTILWELEKKHPKQISAYGTQSWAKFNTELSKLSSATNFCFVSGHDFSRDVKAQKRVGLQSLRENYCLQIESVTRHKGVILSGAPHRFIARHTVSGAQSKDPEGAYLTYAARSFSTTKARHGDTGCW